MALDQFVIAVLPQHSRSVVDQRLEAEEQETAKYTLITAKDQKKIKQQIQSRMEAITKPVEMIGIVSHTGSNWLLEQVLIIQQKRKAEELWTEPKVSLKQ